MCVIAVESIELLNLFREVRECVKLWPEELRRRLDALHGDDGVTVSDPTPIPGTEVAYVILQPSAALLKLVQEARASLREVVH